MNERISVDCTIRRDGRVKVRRVKPGDKWMVVEQGRQWEDDAGRHVLIMLPDGPAAELLLSASSLCWEWKPLPGAANIV